MSPVLLFYRSAYNFTLCWVLAGSGLHARKSSREFLGQRLLHWTVAPLISKAHCSVAVKQAGGSRAWKWLLLDLSSPVGCVSIARWKSVSLTQLFPLHTTSSFYPQNTRNHLLHPAYNVPTVCGQVWTPKCKKTILQSCHLIRVHPCFKLFPVLYFTPQALFLSLWIFDFCLFTPDDILFCSSPLRGCWSWSCPITTTFLVLVTP